MVCMKHDSAPEKVFKDKLTIQRTNNSDLTDDQNAGWCLFGSQPNRCSLHSPPFIGQNESQEMPLFS